MTSYSDVSQNLSLVMTLRDVGLFIKIEKFDKTTIYTSHNNIKNVYRINDNKSNGTKDQDQEIGTNDEEDNDEKFLITCNIYDLDLKSKMKYKHWLKVENDLQEIYNSSNPNWRYCIKYDQIHH